MHAPALLSQQTRLMVFLAVAMAALEANRSAPWEGRMSVLSVFGIKIEGLFFISPAGHRKKGVMGSIASPPVSNLPSALESEQRSGRISFVGLGESAFVFAV